MTVSPFLRNVLLLDALVSGATGLVLVLGAGLAEPLLGLPAALARGAGFVLLPFAAIVGWLATRPSLPRGAVWSVIVVNALWAIDSVVLLLTGWVAPTGLGIAFVLFQAIVVAGFAELQWLGLRRSSAAVAA